MYKVNIFYDKLNNYKDIILEELIKYYGIEYTNKIIKRYNKTFFILDSDPINTFKYILNNKQDFKAIDILKYYKTYILYKNLFINNSNKHMLWVEKYINTYLTDKKINIKKEEIQELFLNYIDAFSTQNENLLSNSPKIVKDNILKRRNYVIKKMKELNINIKLDNKTIDNLIEFIFDSKDYHRIIISKKSELGKYIKDNLKDLSDYSVKNIVFGSDTAFNLVIFYDEFDNTKFYKVLKFPIIEQINKNCNCLDVILIHEIIHCIETNELGNCVGLDNNTANKVFNEIRTQKLAIEIANILHKKDIFIFDNKNNYNDKFTASYEYFKDISYSFINNHEDIIKYCAINNDLNLLYDFFGNNFKIYSKYLDQLYENIKSYVDNGYKINEIKDEHALKLIKKIEDSLINN